MNTFLAEIIKIAEIPEDKINLDTDLTTIEEWDSLAILDLMAYVDEKYDKILSMEELESCNSVRELYQLVTGNK